ncbi:MAG: hypothetical protein II736_06015, partial [Clostridia bacterium]|nr:hypothetical protein [Clostridia bacterium]
MYLLLSYYKTIYPIIRRFLHFFFSMKRKPALKEKSEGGEKTLRSLGRAAGKSFTTAAPLPYPPG